MLDIVIYIDSDIHVYVYIHSVKRSIKIGIIWFFDLFEIILIHFINFSSNVVLSK